MNRIDAHHFSSMTRHIFAPGPGGHPPRWLQSQFEHCIARYRNIPITPNFRAALHRFQSQQQEPFEVFVVGEGNFGKSTLVNALVGQKISAVDFRPETRSFLRYVLKSNPESMSTIYAQLRRDGTHDAVIQRIGDGELREEIYGATRHDLPRDLADEALAVDIANCREAREQGYDYAPAILEIERQLDWTPDSLFPEGVRLVDTQGLNQIFDDDLLERCADLDTFSSEKEFDRWMATSRRGRHLDWQFRRCDAVLWLISAQRPSSGASRSALRYLGKYGKRTVIAVTQIDRVQGGVIQLNRVLAEIRLRFGEFASEIVPINGKLAMESSLSQNIEGIVASGLTNLVGQLRTICLEDAGRIRAKSQYVSLFTTESQMRLAICTMIGEIELTRKRLAILREEVDSTRTRAEATIKKATENSSRRELSNLKKRAENISLMHDADSALGILQPEVARANFENSSRSACIVLEAEIETLIDLLKKSPFSLPTFDSEGHEDGYAVSASFDAALGSFRTPKLSFSFDLEIRPFKAASIWLRKKLPWMREEAEAEERRLNQQRRSEILSALKEEWNTMEEKTVDHITQQAEKVFRSLHKDLNRVEAEIEVVDGRSLEETSTRLGETVAVQCVHSPYITTVLQIMRSSVARARKNKIVDFAS